MKSAVAQLNKPLAVSGFTLIEMMIALGLGIALLAVLVRVFVSLWLVVSESASAVEVTERAALLSMLSALGRESAAVAALHKAAGSLPMLNNTGRYCT